MEAKGYISSDAGPSGTQTTHIFHISILLHPSTDFFIFFSSPLELGEKSSKVQLLLLFTSVVYSILDYNQLKNTIRDGCSTALLTVCKDYAVKVQTVYTTNTVVCTVYTTYTAQCVYSEQRPCIQNAYGYYMYVYLCIRGKSRNKSFKILKM